MRILRLKFKNIASFRSENLFEIDFTKAPLSQQSLFLITGNTGAGKSTLLDAMSVALYNKYTREKSTENFISQMATNAVIELEYEKDGTAYRNVWKIQRSRNKLDGNITVKMEMFYVDSGVEIASGIKEVVTKTKEILGLDFHQFTKTIILPQGEFAKFLHAEEKVKIELFEKITDTRKYREFSQFVFARNKIEEETLSKLMEKIGNSEPMNENEEQSLLNEIQQLESQITNLSADINNINVKKQHLLKIQDLQTQLQTLQLHFVELTDKKESFVTLEQSVSQAKIANELIGIFNNIEVQKVKLQEAKNSKEQLQTQKSNAEIDRDAFQNEFLHHTKQLDEQNDKLSLLSTSLPSYREKIQALTTIVNELQRTIVELTETNDSITQQISQLETLQLQRAENDGRKNQLFEYVNKNSFYLEAPVDINKLHHIVKDRSLLRKNLGEYSQKINAHTLEIQDLQKELLEKEKSLQDRTSQIAPPTSFSDEGSYPTELLKTILSNYGQLELFQKQLHDIETTIEVNNKLFRESQTTSASIPNEIVQLSTEIEKLSNEIQHKEVEMRIQEFRSNLIEGEPCPLCGSMEHSLEQIALHTNPLEPTEAISTVQRQKQFLEEERNRKTKVLQFEELQQKDFKKKIEESQQVKSTLENEISIIFNLFISSKIAVNPTTFESIENEIQARNNNQIIKLQIENDVISISANQKELNRLEEQIETLKANEISTISQEKLLEIETISILKKYQLSNDDDLDISIQNIKSSYTSFESSKTEFAQIESDILVADSNIKSLQDAHAVLQAKKVQLSVKIEEFENNQKVKLAEKTELFGDVDIEFEHSQTLLQTQQMQRKNQEMHLNLQQKLDNVKTLEHSIVMKTNEIEQYILPEINRMVESLEIGMKKHNFDSIDAVYTASLPLEKLTMFELEISTYNEEFSNIQFSINEKSSILKELLSTQPKETADEIENILLQYEEQKSTCIEHLGAKKLLEQQNNELKSQYQQFQIEYEQQKQVTNKWNKLNQFIGSQSGDKYQKIVQRITMSQLLQYTNNHLREFTNRYTIALHTTEQHSLDLFIIDNENNFKQREVTTLSGGETFLVSLSMALGIATMISNATEIESLFLDEGFGTLDQNTLETVMLALENLQQKGRKIGIISHVELLRERISTQIVVEAIGNGTSKVYVQEK
jgi:exonuclease SbcC